MKISAKSGKLAPLTVDVNIPAALADKVKLYGEEVVNSAAQDSLVISVQALMRRHMVDKVDKAGKVVAKAKTASEIQAAITAWKPDVRSVVRQSAFEKASTSLDKLTPDERKALLAKLQALR